MIFSSRVIFPITNAMTNEVMEDENYFSAFLDENKNSTKFMIPVKI